MNALQKGRKSKVVGGSLEPLFVFSPLAQFEEYAEAN